MRNTPNYGLAAAALIAAKIAQRHGAVARTPKPARELTERERWNAEVEAKKAAKKARRAGIGASSDGAGK